MKVEGTFALSISVQIQIVKQVLDIKLCLIGNYSNKVSMLGAPTCKTNVKHVTRFTWFDFKLLLTYIPCTIEIIYFKVQKNNS